MSRSKLSIFLIPAALMFVTLPCAAVEDLSPQEAQEVDQEYQRLESQGKEQGGATQTYIDETNADLQVQQPTEVELQNQQAAEQLYQEQKTNKPVKPPVPAGTN